MSRSVPLTEMHVLTPPPGVAASMRGWTESSVLRTERLLRATLSDPLRKTPELLQQAMEYACLEGGKRMRPCLVYACAQAATGRPEHPDDPALDRLAMAVEMIHAYSLILDDLPAMDNDELRRGKPTLHIAFDQATAMLAGTALLFRAFEVLADSCMRAELSTRLIRELTESLGRHGVTAGQLLDLSEAAQDAAHGSAGSNGQASSLARVERIHALKTAAFLRACCRAGALVAGATERNAEMLGQVGHYLGLAYQAVDDLLDEMGIAEFLGKNVHRDRALGKATIPGVVGRREAQSMVWSYAASANRAIRDLGPEADPLRYMVSVVVGRLAKAMQDKAP